MNQAHAATSTGISQEPFAEAVLHRRPGREHTTRLEVGGHVRRGAPGCSGDQVPQRRDLALVPLGEHRKLPGRSPTRERGDDGTNIACRCAARGCAAQSTATAGPPSVPRTTACKGASTRSTAPQRPSEGSRSSKAVAARYAPGCGQYGVGGQVADPLRVGVVLARRSRARVARPACPRSPCRSSCPSSCRAVGPAVGPAVGIAAPGRAGQSTWSCDRALVVGSG